MLLGGIFLAGSFQGLDTVALSSAAVCVIILFI